MLQDQTITFRVSGEMKQALTEAAAADFRTMSQLLTKIIAEWQASRPTNVLQFSPASPPRIKYGRPRGRPRGPVAQDGEHPWRRMIEPWLGERERVTVDEVLESALKIAPASAHIGQRNGVESVLAELGWTEALEREQGHEDRLAWHLKSPFCN